MSMFGYHNTVKVSVFVTLLTLSSFASAQESAPPPTLAPPVLTEGADDASAATTPPPAAAVAPAPTTDPAATPSAALEPAPTVPAPSDAVPPPLSETLNEQGAAPAALPPGFDLPLDDAGQSTITEKSPDEKKMELRQKAFDAAVNGLFTLTPDEIRKMLELNDETKQAAETPLVPTPNMESVFTTISLDPGSKPLIVKTAIGSVTTLSMVDASGQPWPIRDLSWAGNFDIQQPESEGNMLRITPTSEFAYGNVSMRMKGLNPPIILVFKADRETVHVRIDIQIPELGPNGIAPLIDGNAVSTTAGSARMASVLEGIAPAQATKLEFSGVDGRTTAYMEGGRMYLRTPYTLLSPAWSSSVRSADGTNVYSLSTTPVLLMSDKGRMVRATLVSGQDQASISVEDQANGQ